jgi:glycosyltransferase involved in cell wall biosynthesis/ubiquinone/menaquinone biosynthesis C-methylase UbiE
MSRRRLLYVIHYPVFGGPHNRALLLAEPLARRGWETELLIPEEPGNAGKRFEAAGIHVTRLPLTRIRATLDPSTHIALLWSFRDNIQRIRTLLKEREIDIVVIGGLVNPHAAIAARLEGVAVVWQVLDTRAPLALRAALAPIVLGLADVVMTTGRRVAALHPGFGRLGDRLMPFYGPVDLDRFTADGDARRRARRELGFPEDVPVVGTVGNLSPMKRHSDFVAAAAALRWTHPTVRFAILGASYEYRAHYADALLRQAAALGLRPGIDLVIRDPGGRVAELAPAFDVFWLSSDAHSEGVPTVVGEAMALGIPIVTTNAGGVAEVVEHGTVGFVVPPRKPLALADATRPLLDSPSLRASLGAAGRDRASEIFALERNVETHDTAFRMALNRNRVRLAARLTSQPANDVDLDTLVRDLLACPICRARLTWRTASATCTSCGAAYPIMDGIPVLVGETADPHKQQQAAFFDEVEDEFEITRPHVTPQLYRWLLGEKFRRSVSAISQFIPGAVVLTVCGGSGMDAEFLARAGARVIVSDISLEAARRARSRAQRYGLPLTTVVADVEALPFADRVVDLVYVHDGLHHLERPSAGLAEIARVAAHAVSVNEPARAAVTRLAMRFGLSQEIEEAGNRVERVDPARFATVLRAAGFRIVKSERYAMLYRHQAGPAMRLFSTRVLYPEARFAIAGFNHFAGEIGNKLTIQACR